MCVPPVCSNSPPPSVPTIVPWPITLSNSSTPTLSVPPDCRYVPSNAPMNRPSVIVWAVPACCSNTPTPWKPMLVTPVTVRVGREPLTVSVSRR